MAARRAPTDGPLLATSRLKEVARAALLSAGVRPRLATQPSAPAQLPETAFSALVGAAAPDPLSLAAEPSPKVEPLEGSGPLKRELPSLADSSDANGAEAPDFKRLRSDSGGEARSSEAAVLQPGPADAAARIGPNAGEQQAAPAKQDTPPAPISVTPLSPFAKPAGRFSVSGAMGEAGVANGPAGNGLPSNGPAGNGPGGNVSLKSAFSSVSSQPLPGEWLPGCSVTTGRRSARSPAPKGSRNLSLARAASADVSTSPASRRGSLAGPAAASAFALVDPPAVNGGASAGAAGEDGAQGGAAPGPWGPGAKPETKASAGLAQLAEAAAMLEGLAGPRPGGAGVANGAGAAGQAAGGAPGEDGLVATAAPAGEIASLTRHRSQSLASGSGAGPWERIAPALLGLQGGREAGGRASLAGMTSAPAAGGPQLRGAGSMPLRMAESQPAPEGREGSADPEGNGNSNCNSRRGNEDYDDDDMGDGSNDNDDSGGGGSSGGRSLTDRYRAVLKASAQQRGGRGGSASGGEKSGGGGSSRQDPDKLSSRASARNGVCARIASITKERLQQVYHLNIEEAARELGIGMTKLKEHCRTLGIPRWPSRKLKSMDKLIESLNERALTEPATKEVINDILAEIEQFKRAIYENPCLEVEEDIKRLRQSNFKKEYQQRQVEQRMRGPGTGGGAGSGGGDGAGSGRTTSANDSQQNGGGGGLQQASSVGAHNSLREVTSMLETASGGVSPTAGGPSAATAAALAAGLPPVLAAGLNPAALLAGPPGVHGLPGVPSSAADLLVQQQQLQQQILMSQLLQQSLAGAGGSSAGLGVGSGLGMGAGANGLSALSAVGMGMPSSAAILAALAQQQLTAAGPLSAPPDLNVPPPAPLVALPPVLKTEAAPAQ